MMDLKRIAILRRNGLGDLLCTYPLIAHLRNRYPGANITLFLDESNASLVPYLPGSYDTAVIRRGNKYIQTLRAAFARRKLCFDLAIAARPEPMRLNNCFLTFLNARRKMAVIERGLMIGRVVDMAIDPTALTGRHQALKLLQMVDPGAVEIPMQYIPYLQLPKEKMQPYTTALQKCFPKTEGPLLLVSASNNRDTSLLKSAKLAHILAMLPHGRPYQVAISCLPCDRQQAEEILRAIPAKAAIWESPSFDSFMALLAYIDCCLIGSGGITHLAAALQKPQLVLFGATPVPKWHPLSDLAICLYHPSDVNQIDDAQIALSLDRLLASITALSSPFLRTDSPHCL